MATGEPKSGGFPWAGDSRAPPLLLPRYCKWVQQESSPLLGALPLTRRHAGPLAFGLPSSGRTSDKEAQGVGLQGTTAPEHVQCSLVWPGGYLGWQALRGPSPGFQGAKAKPGQEFLALILASNSSQK